MEVHRSAHRHGVADVDINHAGNLLEVMVLELADERFLVIQAMSLRPSLHHLLPEAENHDG